MADEGKADAEGASRILPEAGQRLMFTEETLERMRERVAAEGEITLNGSCR